MVRSPSAEGYRACCYTPRYPLPAAAQPNRDQEACVREHNLDLTPEDLGTRITYLASGPITKTSVPDCDFAVPFALGADT